MTPLDACAIAQSVASEVLASFGALASREALSASRDALSSAANRRDAAKAPSRAVKE
jgi:hypothetical protein